MNPNHYSELVPLKIYALISGTYVFIGKSKSPTLASAYSRHTHGYCYVTDGYFSPKGENRPLLYLLKHAKMTQAEGYKHILAYIRYFDAHDYEILNYDKSIIQSQEMDPVTESFYRQISSIPLSTTLKLSYLPKPSSPIDVGIPLPENPPALEKVLSSERLCIRLAKKEKMDFEALATQLHLSQRDLLIYFLNRENNLYRQSEGKHIKYYIPRVISSYEAKLASKDERIEKLEKQLNAQLLEGQARSLKDRIKFIQEGVHRYFDLAGTSKNHPTLLRDKYRRFSQSFPQDQQYHFPKEDGLMVFRPEYILWGQSSTPVCFILGIGEDGDRYKFRYYNKYYCIGPRLINEEYGYEGSEWLVGFERASDGASDITLSLPLDVLSVHTKRSQEGEDMENALDAIIAEAEMQKNYFEC